MEKSDRQATISLEYSWPFGLFAENTSPESRLFASYGQIRTGKPLGSLTYLFLRTSDPIPHSTEKRFWLKKLWNNISPTRRHPIYHTLPRLLGTLCHTAGGMLLYFPGYRGTSIQAYDKHKLGSRRDPFLIDHFSLEPGFERWHITAYDKARVRRLKVMTVADERVFWFAMSVRAATEFEPVYRNNRVQFACPDDDARRRVYDAQRASEGAVSQIVESPIPITTGPAFWHIEFTVSQRAVDGFPKPAHHLPVKPLAETVFSSSDPLPMRSHVVRLPSFEGAVIVTAALVPGKLSLPVILTHP
jgi:hypothetical protein